MTSTQTRTRATALALALLTGATLLSGCTGDAAGTTTSTTTVPPASTSATVTPTSSTTTSAAPTDEELAQQAVAEFYKELDLVAQGKARLDSFTHAASGGGGDPTATLMKWRGLLSNQLLQKGVQVGETKVYDLTVKPSKRVDDGEKPRPAWTVTGCVDRSGIHIEDKTGKTVDSSGQQETSMTTHVVIDVDGAFMVLRDDPGKSC